MSVTGSVVSRGTAEFDGLVDAVPKVALAANTKGELPIANSAATAISSADLTMMGFMTPERL